MSNRDATATAIAAAPPPESGRLRVAIDTSFLALPPSGIGTYVRCLLAALPAAAPDIDVIPLSPGWNNDAAETWQPWHRITADAKVRRALWDLRGVDNAARRAKPHLLHVPQFAAPFPSSTPLVVTVHDVIPLLLDDYRRSRAMRLNLAVMRRTVRRADRIIAPSHAAAADIVRVLDVPAEHLSVVPLAAAPDLVPADRDAARRFVAGRFGIQNDYVFNIAGFDRRKNLPVLIEAFAQVRAKLDRPISLVIAGSPHTANPHVFPDVHPLIATLGLESSVLLPGNVTDEERRHLYGAASAYATPSLYEGFGLTPLEAMACGVPTIVADRTSLPEVVGDAGLVVPPTADAFAEALLATLTEASVSSRLSLAGINRARTFSWERTARETAAVYRAIATCGTGWTCRGGRRPPDVASR